MESLKCFLKDNCVNLIVVSNDLTVMLEGSLVACWREGEYCIMGTHEVMHETHLSISFKERDPEREQRFAREAEDQLRLKKVRYSTLTCEVVPVCLFSSFSLYTFIQDR